MRLGSPKSRSRPSRSPRGLRFPRTLLKLAVSLKFQAGFAGRVREGLHAPVIQPAIPVKAYFGDVQFPGLLAQRLAHGLGALDVSARCVQGQGRRRGQGAAGGVVDDLGVDVFERTVYGQTGPLRRADHAVAHARLAANQPFLHSFPMCYRHGTWTPNGVGPSYFEPALPTLRRTTSLS